MHCHDPFESVLQDRLRTCCPRELCVALVAKYRDVVRATPVSCIFQVVKRASGIAGAVHPQHERAIDVVFANRCEVHVTFSVGGHRHRAKTCEHRTHFVGGVCDGWIQHCVAVRATKLHELRRGGDEFFRADTRGDTRDRNINAKSTTHPSGDGTAQCFRTN